ncbi:unnamed protein product, partial [Allacma fusca]
MYHQPSTLFSKRVQESTSSTLIKMKKEKPMMSVTAIIQGSQNHWNSRASVT